MADVLASCITNLIASAIGSICSCIDGKTKGVRNLSANLHALDRAVVELRALSKDVTRKVNKAEENPKMQRREVVKLWFEEVERVESEVFELLKDRDQEVDKLCVLGCCSKDFKSSYLFGRKVEDLLQEVTDLKLQGEAFEDVALEVTATAREEPIDQRTIVGQESVLDEVWRYLRDENCGMIGLYGMPGVGKTTLLKQINNRFCSEPLGFQAIIMVVVSNTSSFDNIREDIGKRLGLSDDRSWEKRTPEDRAKEISNTLCKKKFVLLLDDIWQRIELADLGVPLQCLKSGSKLLFSTRKSDVCSKMEADKKVEVKCLNFKEASELFQQKVGKDTLDSHPLIRKLADEVVKECDCLPLALITVGGVMAGNDTPKEWERAVQVLRTSAAEFEDMEKKVFCRLKFSYDSLPSDTTRSCLLYCRLYPEDYEIHIRGLIDCWIGEGFLGEYGGGEVIIGELVRACLLEKGDEDKIKMHDVIRDMTLWIACGSEKVEENCLVQAGIGLTEAPEVEKWEGIKRMSLMANKIKRLPTVSTRLDLQTLFLKNNFLCVIPSNDFFQYMPFLKVLDLSRNTSLRQVPSGIALLVSLQHLDLSYTHISDLPEELSALGNLKCLKLEDANQLQTIPRKLISELKQLQVFRLINCFLETGSGVLSGGHELLVEELWGLENLEALTINLRGSHATQKFSTSHILRSCTQTLHLHSFMDLRPVDALFLKDMKNLGQLYISGCHFEVLKIDFAAIVNIETHGFHSIHTVGIVNCKNVRDLTWLILAPNLKTIEIKGCCSMIEIISDKKLNEVQKNTGILNPLAKLQRLDLQWLARLKIISQNSLPLPRLEHLFVRDCPKLKELPLNSDSAKDRQIIIEGEEDWWKNLQWKDEATKNAFCCRFKSLLQ